MIDLLEYKEM